MGKSSSGKDTIFKELLLRSSQNAAKADDEGGVGLKTIVPYTTRPIRAGEQEGVEYHFTDEIGFQTMLKSGKVIEQREYHTFHGIWRYFTVDDGQFVPEGRQNYIMIGTLEAYRSMQRYFGPQKVFPILIELDDGVRLQRALNREKNQAQPKYEEMCRRFLADSADFAEGKIKAAGISRRFRNDNLDGCLEEIMKYIQEQE